MKNKVKTENSLVKVDRRNMKEMKLNCTRAGWNGRNLNKIEKPQSMP